MRIHGERGPDETLFNRFMLSVIWLLSLPFTFFYWLMGWNPNDP